MAGFRWTIPVALLLAVGLQAQEMPSGWKVVKDLQGKCQLAVPPDWVPDSLVKSFVNSADGKSNAVAHPSRPGQSFSEVTALAKQVMPPTKSLEDSAQRVWYAYTTNNSAQGATNWYIAVPGTPICTAQVTFKVAADEAIAKKIALSLTQAK